MKSTKKRLTSYVELRKEFDCCNYVWKAYFKECLQIWQSVEYKERVNQLEDEGLTTSDAQSVADTEFGILITD